MDNALTLRDRGLVTIIIIMKAKIIVTMASL